MANRSRLTEAQGKRTLLLITRQDALQPQLVRQLRRVGGHSIVGVASGRAAVDSLVRHPVDLVVLDLGLADTDGWKIVRMIRSGRFCPATLPVVAIVRDDADLSLAQSFAYDHQAHCLVAAELDRLPGLITAALADQAAARPTLLVIEDDRRAARLIADSLRGEYRVDRCYDGETGLAAWREQRHTLVLLDMQLPLRTGAEVLRAIVATDPEQPVIIITAYPSQDRHRDLMLAGAADFVAKPFAIPDLRTVCRRTLHQRAVSDQARRRQTADRRQHDVGQRLRVANHYLSRGRTGLAAEHLSQALALSRPAPLSDDDWARLCGEFDDG